MKRLFAFFLLLLSLSCDDGNFDVPEFDFSSIDNIGDCSDVVLYKINENETLIIEIAPNLSSTTEETFLTHDWGIDGQEFAVSTSSKNKITYRTLSEKPTTNYFCQNIPPTSPKVINEWVGTGFIVVTTDFSEDDNDGVDEVADDSINDDEDGFPNYKDSDDDGDGIRTIDEDVDGDGDPTNDDTDGDGTPDYLDKDDDEDGVLTKFESATGDANDNDIPDYLDPATELPLSEEKEIKNNYDKIFKHSILLQQLKLTNQSGNTINYDSYEFGVKEEVKQEIEPETQQ